MSGIPQSTLEASVLSLVLEKLTRLEQQQSEMATLLQAMAHQLDHIYLRQEQLERGVSSAALNVREA